MLICLITDIHGSTLLARRKSCRKCGPVPLLLSLPIVRVNCFIYVLQHKVAHKQSIIFLSAVENIIGTVGGDAICFIDCSLQRVVAKYSHEGECFYCLDWAVFDCPKPISLVAAAGK